MAYTAYQFSPRVVELGGAQVKDNTYKADTGADWKAGQLLRITTSGTLKPVVADADASINAIALDDYDASVEGAVFKPVMLIDKDTRFEGQLNSAVAPAQGDIGDQRIIALSSGTWAVDAAGGTNMQVEVTDVFINNKWFMSGKDEAGSYGLVYFKVLDSRIEQAKTA